MKKTTKATSNDVDSEEGMDTTMFLSTQNKALVMEMKRYKRQIAETKRELDIYKSKTREMESLVSIIQRAWAQLDVDMSSLLDSYGDEEVDINDNENFHIMKLFLLSGRKYMLINPIDVANSLPSLQIDEWASSADIEKQKINSLEYVNNKMILKSLYSTIDEEVDNMDEKLSNHLISHISFTLALLERLCMFIASSETNHEVFDSISKIKELQAEKLVLSDTMDILANEIIDLNTKIHYLNIEKKQSNRIIDRLNDELANKSNSNINVNDVSSLENNTSVQSPTKKVTSTYDLEQIQKIEMLEKQLAESESAKIKIELELNERLAHPTIQIENQFNDMRKAMEELRQQCKQRVCTLMAECNELKDKTINQEIAMQELQTAYIKKFEQLQTLTIEQIHKLEKEKNELLLELTNYKAEMTVIDQLKTQNEEYRLLDINNKIELKRLEDKLSSMISIIPELNNKLKKSRENEIFLENSIKVLTNDQLSYDDEMNQMIVTQAQIRTKEIQQELDNINLSMDDLILEIETVSKQEKNAREQVSRLLNQVNDSQSMQRGILDENLKLNNQIIDSQKKLQDSLTKLEISEKVSKQQHMTILNYIENEQILQKRITDLSKFNKELSDKLIVTEENLLDIKQNNEIAETNISNIKKYNVDLQGRCDELTRNIEKERKLRMTLQQKLQSKRINAINSIVESTGTDNTKSKNDQMLEITLGMLRCSVCKDRFKEVAITRCFHLFCKECIDENLRNRHRKCPACGEKFGQDDVKTIYFTH